MRHRNAKPRAKRGRPTKRTKDSDEVVLRMLRLGLDFATAAAAIGVHPDTLREWRAKDEDFAVECEKAQAQANASATAMLWKNMRRGSDRAVIFYLSRRVPEFKQEAAGESPGSNGWAEQVAAMREAQASLPIRRGSD